MTVSNLTTEGVLFTLQVSRIPRSTTSSTTATLDALVKAHVEETVQGQCVIVESSFVPSRNNTRTVATFRMMCTSPSMTPQDAARRLRETIPPWEGPALHVQVVVAVATSHKTTKTKQKNNKQDRIRVLADAYHAYLLSDAQRLDRCSDREALSTCFRHFVEQVRHEMYTSFLEASVMTRLRQTKRVKSRRHGDKVVMCFADASGTFPSLQDREEIKNRVLQQKELEEADKNGVVVSRLQDMPDLIPVRGTISLNLVVVAESSAYGNTILEAIELAGAQKRSFTMAHVALPMLLLANDLVTVAFQSTGAGVYRAIVRMRFRSGRDSFTIARHVTLKSGDAAMEGILKPTSPYTRRSRGYYEKPPSEFIPAPTVAQSGMNPFACLPQSKIPGNVRQLIASRELESALRKPDERIEDYEEFWKFMLWASEWQAHEDIKLFDMEGACLKKEGRYFVLTVPGLAEGRPSVLRGDIVKITWKDRQYQGRVHRVRLLDLLMEFNESFHRSFNVNVDRGNVRFTFTRTTFRTSHEGCRVAPLTMGSRMLVPKEEEHCASRGRTGSLELKYANLSLNDEQQTAVERILVGTLRPLPYIIFGPPGTGKTTTVTEVIYQLAHHKDNLRVLLVAPSNDATDILVEKLATFFPPSEMRRIVAYTRSIDQLAPAARPYARDGLSSEEQLDAIMSVRIVVSTVNLAARFSYFGVPKGHFDVLCVDEAGHATEPEVIGVAATLMDFRREDNKVGQLILAGDPRQLGPVITSDICIKFGMAQSYMERLTKTDLYERNEAGQYRSDLLTKLVRNYRSHPSILKLPNEMFYDNDLLVCGHVMKTHSMTRWEHLPNPTFPVIFHAVNGENLREGNSPSWFNPQEVQEVVAYVDLLVNESRPSVGLQDIGIITPYARQAQKIRLALGTRNFQDIKVGSVETFQGQERRCIILSTVRSQGEFVESDVRHNLGFVANEKRFNVAITRAQALVVVVGCPSVLAMDKKNWLPFLRYCHDNKSWSGQEWDEEDSEEELHDASNASEVSEWDFVESTPSRVVEVEGVVFINREE